MEDAFRIKRQGSERSDAGVDLGGGGRVSGQGVLFQNSVDARIECLQGLGMAAAVTSRTTCRILEPFRAGRWLRPARSPKTGTRPTTRGSRPAKLVWALAFSLGRVLEQDGLRFGYFTGG